MCGARGERKQKKAEKKCLMESTIICIVQHLLFGVVESRKMRGVGSVRHTGSCEMNARFCWENLKGITL
jgi:uncharacterized Fe-S cluster-containing radical SAM superfamily enzyme